MKKKTLLQFTKPLSGLSILLRFEDNWNKVTQWQNYYYFSLSAISGGRPPKFATKIQKPVLVALPT